MAWAASASVSSRVVSKAKGSRVWSIIPTLEPSAYSQIGRQGLPFTFMDSILLRAMRRLWKCPLPRAASTVDGHGQRIKRRLATAQLARRGPCRENFSQSPPNAPSPDGLAELVSNDSNSMSPGAPARSDV
jgi:hypothetical protein